MGQPQVAKPFRAGRFSAVVIVLADAEQGGSEARRQNTVWHGYQPYNPAMIGKYLTIFRTVANFISVGTDGKTPAMRLGLAKQPLTYEDILWPGERAPRPRRVRRKGRRLSGLRRVPRAKARDSTGSPKDARP